MNQNSSTKKSVNRARKANGNRGKKNVQAPSVQKNGSRQGASGPRQSSVASAYATGQVGKSPVISATRDKCVVSHRELVDSVVGASNFTVKRAFDLNPGLPASFPWLSSIARSWEKYKFRKLKYCYYTRTGTSTTGSLMLAPDYDAADVPPSTEQIASAYTGTAEDAPWKDIVCVLPEHRLHDNGVPKYVRATALAANLDIKTYDCGKMFLCAVDGAVTAWGKLWVEYEVEFSIPALPPAGLLGIGGRINSGGASAANIFGTVPSSQEENVGITIDNASNITFEYEGTYLVSLVMVGTGVTAFTLTPVNVVSIIQASSTFLSNAAASTAWESYQITVSEPGAIINFAATATTISGGNVQIGVAPPDSLT